MNKKWWNKVKSVRYYNANGYAVAVVSSETPIDWAAYIGSTESIDTSMEETTNFVHKHGCKLSERDARHYCPELKGKLYRV